MAQQDTQKSEAHRATDDASTSPANTGRRPPGTGAVAPGGTATTGGSADDERKTFPDTEAHGSRRREGVAHRREGDAAMGGPIDGGGEGR